MMLYRLTGIKRYYNERCALSIDHLVIEEGKIYGLVGPNGSGKTTLLRILAFLDEPDAGNIYYNGSLVSPQLVPSLRREVTMLLQNTRLLTRRVKDNVAFGLKMRHMDLNTIKHRVKEALEMVGLPVKDFANRQWYELSGGEAQRVALAARLALRPKVLLLDEPTANVDTVSETLINEAVVRAKEEWKTTIIMVSHDLLWLYNSADETISLWGGRVASHGPENVILGPWEKVGDGLYCKKLKDGQKIYVSGIPSSSNAVTVSPGDISLLSNAINDDGGSSCNLLRGLVTQMVYSNDGLLRVSIALGELNLVSLVDKDYIKGLDIYPGMEVYASFKPSAAQWL